MAVNDGVVNSQDSRASIPMWSRTPSPVWPTYVIAYPTWVQRGTKRTAKRTLYVGSGGPTSANSVQVDFYQVYTCSSCMSWPLSSRRTC